MTEQEFDQQVWRRFDVVTTDTGIETTVMNVCFTTRSVRIYVKNAPPEWLPAKRIEKHTTRKVTQPMKALSSRNCTTVS